MHFEIRPAASANEEISQHNYPQYPSIALSLLALQRDRHKEKHVAHEFNGFC